jgi:hypothetical protein
MIAPTLRQTVEGLSLGFEPRMCGLSKTVLEFEATGERPRCCRLVFESIRAGNSFAHFRKQPYFAIQTWLSRLRGHWDFLQTRCSHSFL